MNEPGEVPILYKRSLLLINRRFQFRFAFYVCSWLIALSFSYPLIISNIFDYFLRYMINDPMGPAVASLIKTRESLLWLLLTMQVILISLAFLISLFMSHKIAGPLYKLRQAFLQVGQGKLDLQIKFRAKDYFPELAPEFNAMMDKVRTRVAKNEEVIRLTIPTLEKAIETASPETLVYLETALTTLRESKRS